LNDHLRRWCWGVAAKTRFPLPALHYHHAALEAAQERDFALAGRLFERAVAAYRATCDVERLAHARIHQLFVRLAARGPLIPILETDGPSERINRLRSAERPGAGAGVVQPGQEQRRDDARPRSAGLDAIRPAA
jgi:hypothetical protein